MVVYFWIGAEKSKETLMREGVEEDVEEREEGRRLDMVGMERKTGPGSNSDKIKGCTMNTETYTGLCRIKVPYTMIPLYCSCRYVAGFSAWAPVRVRLLEACTALAYSRM